MAKGYLDIIHAQVKDLEQGDIIRFFDSRDDTYSDRSVHYGWFVVARVEPVKLKVLNNILSMTEITVWDGERELRTTRRPWTAVQIQNRLVLHPLNGGSVKWELPIQAVSS